METLTQVAPKNNELEKKEPTPSERFQIAVMNEFAANGLGEVTLTSYQKKLIQNYFIKLDMILKESEAKRLATAEKYRDPLAYSWHNVNLQKLANDVVTYSSVGLDPTQPNHINPVPYKNKKINKFDISFIIGYKGMEVKATKYALDMPDAVIVELVKKNDKFKQTKKDKDHPHETYVFEVEDPFDRGEIVGGFYYHQFNDKPEKNKLRVFTKADIEKRKPDHASADFWGGEKDKWEYDETTGRNKKVGKEEVEGWLEEMCFKTIYRAAYNSITIDSEKIDQNYLAVIQKERETRDLKVITEINENANGVTGNTAIGIDEENEDFKPADVVNENDNEQDSQPEVLQTSIGTLQLNHNHATEVAEPLIMSHQNGKHPDVKKKAPF